MEVNPQQWYGERELSFTPPYFTKATTPVTPESLFWVRNKLTGRYCLVGGVSIDHFVFDPQTYIYFEDPSEATVYELRWAGTK